MTADMHLGGLIVLILFLHQLAIFECVEMFDALAKQLFPHSLGRKNIFSRLHQLLKCWYRDGCYDAQILEACLKEKLGCTTRLFDHVPSLIATKVGVTTATIDAGFPVLLINYNGLGKFKENCGKLREAVLLNK